VVARVREFGLDAQISRGASRVIIGVIGAEDRIREKPLAAMPGVEAIVPVEKPYKLASYEFRGAASPVGPHTTKPSEPCSARWPISATNDSSSTRPRSSKGVTIAVRIVPSPLIVCSIPLRSAT